ncbi:MAG TPA: hypothetical protein PJ986_04685 [Gammaproteobacteria bacterium]|nr:hypothetical protein [Gammaproteobacteria bacterium]
MKIGSAVFLGLMIAFLLPRAKAMMENSPEAKPGDWTGALIPIFGVLGFVLLLMSFM